MNISWMSRRPRSIQSQSGCDSVSHGSIGHLTGLVLSPVGQDRSDQEQPEPRLRQGVLAGLLLWGGAEAEIWSLRHPWHTQYRDPRRRLPGRSGVHPRPGGLKVGGKLALHSLLLSREQNFSVDELSPYRKCQWLTKHGCVALGAEGHHFCVYLLLLQIVAQKKMLKPLLLKYGKYAGKSTITVGLRFLSTPVCLHRWTS